MSEDINSVSILLRREIEALVAVPLLKAFIKEFGEEKTLEVAKGVIKNLAMDAGKMMAELAGGNKLSDLEKVMPAFSQGDAVEFDTLESGDKKIVLKVTRCRYAEMYKEHDLAEFGFLMSCGRDGFLFAGFNPDIEFTRNNTIMEGADHCDFCLEDKDG